MVPARRRFLQGLHRLTLGDADEPATLFQVRPPAVSEAGAAPALRRRARRG